MSGPASVHSEYAQLADTLLAVDTTVFSDFHHLTLGILPGDGVHIARGMAEGIRLDGALEGLTAADLLTRNDERKHDHHHGDIHLAVSNCLVRLPVRADHIGPWRR